MRAIARGLIRRARDGDNDSVRLLFSYVLGRPLEADILERVESLERELAPRDDGDERKTA
jgi:hypothetical protein